MSGRREDDSSLAGSSLDDGVSEGIYAGIYGRYQP